MKWAPSLWIPVGDYKPDQPRQGEKPLSHPNERCPRLIHHAPFILGVQLGMICITLLLLIHIRGLHSLCLAQQADAITFQINEIQVQGNTLLPEERIRELTREFLGPRRTAADVEKAREELEHLYHENGYPTVLVNIPEQTIDEGMVSLQVIESKIGRIKVTGNRYHAEKEILEGLPSFRPGSILSVSRVEADLNRINQNPDLTVSPVLMPGRELGTTDVELKVADRLPLHGHLALDNRSSHNTTDLRANASIRYDNLWQRRHSFSLQYQTSPQKADEVQVVVGSYGFSAPWARDQKLALYGVWSDSETAFGEAFQVIGKGEILGIRHMIPLPPYKDYNHTLSLGMDYKHFRETVGFEEAQTEDETPITYLSASIGYSASLPDTSGHTSIRSSAKMGLRRAITDQQEFEEKRYQARGNYLAVSAGIERMQRIAKWLHLSIEVDGQVSDQPLISNEQYSAGGVESVRGYKESEEFGDNALHTTVEIRNPIKETGLFSLRPYLFYDAALLWLKNPLPGQDPSAAIQGAGMGIQGGIPKIHMEYGIDCAWALENTDKTRAGENRIHFRGSVSF